MPVDDVKIEIFNSLKPVLHEFSERMSVEKDTEDTYYLNTSKTAKNGKPSFFGAVQIKKNYVSFHLMPVYENPSLLDLISDPLRQRMQGKSCFNFKTVDQKLFLELKALTKTGYDFYAKEGQV